MSAVKMPFVRSVGQRFNTSCVSSERYNDASVAAVFRFLLLSVLLFFFVVVVVFFLIEDISFFFSPEDDEAPFFEEFFRFVPFAIANSLRVSWRCSSTACFALLLLLFVLVV